MSLPSRFQRYDSLIDLLVEQAVCDVMETGGEFYPVNSRDATSDTVEEPSSEQKPHARKFEV